MLHDRPRFTIQEIAYELLLRHQLPGALFVYLEESLLKSYVNYPPYLPDGTELSPSFWREHNAYNTNLLPCRINADEFRIPGSIIYSQEKERLETLRNGALKRDPALIDLSLRTLAAQSCGGLRPDGGAYSIRILQLLRTLGLQLEDTKRKKYVVYVAGKEWRRFSVEHLPEDSAQAQTKGKAGPPENVYWRQLHGEIITRVVSKLPGRSLHEFLGFPSRLDLATTVRRVVQESKNTVPGKRLPAAKTVAEELGKLESRASRG